MRAAWSPLDEATPVAPQVGGLGVDVVVGDGLDEGVVGGVAGTATVVDERTGVAVRGSLQAAAPIAKASAIRQVRTRAGRRMVRSTPSGVG